MHFAGVTLKVFVRGFCLDEVFLLLSEGLPGGISRLLINGTVTSEVLNILQVDFVYLVYPV